MAIWTLAKKELRLLLRDPRAAVILLGMPLIFILILGLSLGDTFGQKPDDRLRVSLVDLDRGDPNAGVRQAAGYFAWTPHSGGVTSAVDSHALSAVTLVASFPPETWSRVVRRDLEETAGIRVEIIDSEQEAKRLVARGKRAAILVFRPEFSERVSQCSFLTVGWADTFTFLSTWPIPGQPVSTSLAALLRGQEGWPRPTLDGINPFYRDGVRLKEVGAEMLRDDTQLAAASIIEQVAQVSLLRVILPWMIGRAFEKLGDTAFIDRLAHEVLLPNPVGKPIPLRDILRLPAHKRAVGSGVQSALRKQFPKYELTGKTWAALTRSDPKLEGSTALPAASDVRYQVLVPSYTVTFAFFLVLTVGWLFVSERRQGTLKRLRAAPITRTEVLLGKMLPCFGLSLFQGIFLLSAGRLLFGMRWGPSDWPLWEQAGWIVLVIFATSLAAIGLAMLIAALARTETQVAIYGTLLVLVLAGVSGCLMPRHLMPEQMKQISLVTPHAWALDAYMQLLLSANPNLTLVMEACAVLAGFGVGFTALAWWMLRLD
jgi:ABC-type multidrug transport system permease subunit